MYKKEGAYLQALALPFHFGSRFWPPIFALSFQAISPWHLLLLKQKKKKINTKKKNNNREQKKCREGRELTFLLSLLHLG